MLGFSPDATSKASCMSLLPTISPAGPEEGGTEEPKCEYSRSNGGRDQWLSFNSS